MNHNQVASGYDEVLNLAHLRPGVIVTAYNGVLPSPRIHLLFKLSHDTGPVRVG